MLSADDFRRLAAVRRLGLVSMLLAVPCLLGTAGALMLLPYAGPAGQVIVGGAGLAVQGGGGGDVVGMNMGFQHMGEPPAHFGKHPEVEGQMLQDRVDHQGLALGRAGDEVGQATGGAVEKLAEIGHPFGAGVAKMETPAAARGLSGDRNQHACGAKEQGGRWRWGTPHPERHRQPDPLADSRRKTLVGGSAGVSREPLSRYVPGRRGEINC